MSEFAMTLILQIIDTDEAFEINPKKVIRLPITQDFIIKIVNHEAERQFDIWQIDVLRLPNGMSSYTTNKSSVPIIGTNAEIDEMVYEFIDDLFNEFC